MTTRLLETLQLKDEKNLLIQGLPYSIERQFNKFNYSKSVTPLLKKKKIDFALLFAITKSQLKKIVPEVLEAVHDKSKFWIAYPKPTSKIISDLNSKQSWKILYDMGYDMIQKVNIDYVWDAVRFINHIPKNYNVLGTAEMEEDEIDDLINVDYRKDTLELPEDCLEAFEKDDNAKDFFDSLTIENKRDFILWIVTTDDEEARKQRIDAVVEMLIDGCYNPYLEYMPE